MLDAGNLSFSRGKLSRLHCGWVRKHCLKPSLRSEKRRQLMLVLGQNTVLFSPGGVWDPANICSKIPFQAVPPGGRAATAGAGHTLPSAVPPGASSAKKAH